MCIFKSIIEIQPVKCSVMTNVYIYTATKMSKMADNAMDIKIMFTFYLQISIINEKAFFL